MTANLNPNIPLNPPAEWFTPPTDMPKDAGCIVQADGRVFGYLCHWNSILMDGSTDRWKPPHSKTNYSFAHTGDTECADGTIVKTANLGGDAGHARVGQNVEDIQSYYENTSTQLARVRYGEDDNGVWFAGVCWPTITDFDIARMRASARSGHWAALGDWRDMNSGRSGYELVGACLVNVPGLKYARADKAASGVMAIMPFAPSRQEIGAGFYIDASGFVKFNGEGQAMSAPTKDAIGQKVAASGTIVLQVEEEVAAGDDVPVGGVLVVEGVATEDGRLIEGGAAEWREMPLPLYASLENLPGHESASLVGRIDEVSRNADDPTKIEWRGVIVPSMANGDGATTIEAITNGALKGISIDGIVGPDDWYISPEGVDTMSKIVIAGATLTPMPAIAEASVTILATEREGFDMADVTDQQDDNTEDDVAEETASADQWSAVEEKLNAIFDLVTGIAGTLDAAQLAARYDAAMRRLDK